MKFKDRQTHSNVQGEDNGNSWGMIIRVVALGKSKFRIIFMHNYLPLLPQICIIK